MTRVVLTWYVWEATGSSRALGLLAFLYTGPIIVSGLFAALYWTDSTDEP
ncbi:MAG: hypothetical protein QGG34_08815 [SAR202 cluster bacterium]|jgi:hypothetical protein|nr:hypothetical protein [SAR202 cluster bacterium]MDP6301759.1 hypothetical protein [SAR202 cluster bacterium]MDP7103893.1 hypothetical protein [SAR202 cluster bacterium]MDP7225624.1 hypothetical protein [SAR202 cluster bacterium]MDP7412817.1 hypothetical protein [SAR202 cluster bacterium]|tara:strand:+ start:1388 stop:1537 length:150 start_codon:yes stop_codon:yes gene_type:complete